MRRRLVLVCGMVALVAMLSTGCLFNILQTARTVGGGNLAFTIGAGILMLQGDGTTTNLSATPQARLTLGLADAVDLGLQTGALIPFSSGDPGWLGAIGDLKFRLFDEPDAFALALGFGGGYSVEYIGWGVFGEVFFDSNLRVLPIYFVYQPGSHSSQILSPSSITSREVSSCDSRTMRGSCYRWTTGPRFSASGSRSRSGSRHASGGKRSAAGPSSLGPSNLLGWIVERQGEWR